MRHHKRHKSVLINADLVYFATLILLPYKDSRSVVLEASQNTCILHSKNTAKQEREGAGQSDGRTEGGEEEGKGRKRKRQREEEEDEESDRRRGR